MRYLLQLVWNREFNWSDYGESDDLEAGKKRLTDIRDSGDGARVKKVRIVDNDTGQTVWNG